MGNEANNKRRIYFIEKQFQARFILKFCLLVILMGVLVIGAGLLFARQSTSVSIVNGRVVVRSMLDFLLPTLIQTALVAVILTASATIVVTLFVSHRIAGPLYRFKKVMEGMEHGDFSHGFKLRTHDQLQELAESMNRMLRANRQQFLVIQGLTNMLKHNLDKFQDSDVSSGKVNSLHELKGAVRELCDIADRYKT